MRRRQRGHETLTQFALSMRLIVAKALRRLRRLDEAEYAFKVLAGEPTTSPSESVASDALTYCGRSYVQPHEGPWRPC